jgi:copper chaperone CopZ
MKTITLELPALFADHHVTEVRRLLLGLPGVEEIYASSCFQVAEITFDEKKLEEAQIIEKLEEAGYLGELPFVQEIPGSESQNGDAKPFFRKSALYPQTQKRIGFAQQIKFEGRPLWPCPGIGALKQVEKEKVEAADAK